MMNILCSKALDNELTGMEFAYGIPGTIGGAIRMNAGAYGGEMKDVVQESTYITRDGKIEKINNHVFSYRNSIFSSKNVIVLETLLKLKKGNKTDIKEKMQKNIENRKMKQPLELPNAGSTFKRGDGFITAQLIDEAGLKGFAIGGAQISLKHSGFIVNIGNATAEDILKLVQYVKKIIYDKFSRNIELEIIVIGEK